MYIPFCRALLGTHHLTSLVHVPGGLPRKAYIMRYLPKDTKLQTSIKAEMAKILMKKIILGEDIQRGYTAEVWLHVHVY